MHGKCEVISKRSICLVQQIFTRFLLLYHLNLWTIIICILSLDLSISPDNLQCLVEYQMNQSGQWRENGINLDKCSKILVYGGISRGARQILTTPHRFYSSKFDDVTSSGGYFVRKNKGLIWNVESFAWMGW